MAIKAGQMVLSANGVVLDRVQTGGPSGVNIPTEQIRELGNFKIVAISRDIPDLTFSAQSFDVSTDIEALALGMTPSSVVSGPGGSETTLDFNNSLPMDVLSPFRSANNRFDAVRGVIVPYLNLESVAYKFGVRANAEETFTFRGDSIYYVPGVPYRDVVAPGVLDGGGSHSFTNGPAIEYMENGVANYALSVCWVDFSAGTYKRLFHGADFDFTDTSTGVTINASVDIPSTAEVHITYGSSTSQSWGPGGARDTSSTVVKPANIRAKDIDVYLSNGAATPTLLRLTGVQSFDVTRKVTLQNDEEFGNPHYLASDYDTPDVSGNVAIKGVDPIDLFNHIQAFAGVPTDQISGPLTSPPLAMEARIYHPDDHTNVIKTIYVPDATFSAPAMNMQVNQKLTVTFPFSSDTGSIQVFKGKR